MGAASRNDDVLEAYLGVLGSTNASTLYDLSAADLTKV